MDQLIFMCHTGMIRLFDVMGDEQMTLQEMLNKCSEMGVPQDAFWLGEPE